MTCRKLAISAVSWNQKSFIYIHLYSYNKVVCYACNLILIVQHIAGSLVQTSSNNQAIDHSGKDSILSLSKVKNGRTETKYTYVERKMIEDKLALSPIIVRAKLLKLNKKNKKTNQTQKVLFNWISLVWMQIICQLLWAK